MLGSFPKIPAGAGASVRTAIQRFERGQIGPRELYQTYRDVTGQVLGLAEEARLDMTTDGQIRWNDLFDPVVRDIDNVHSAGLLRLFDNNFYYRHPVITGRLQYQGGVLRAWAAEAASVSRVPMKVAIPGPFTTLALSENRSYADEEALLTDLVEVLRLEAESLVGAGIEEIQWDEPALAAKGRAFSPERVYAVLNRLLSDQVLPQSVALYWGEATPWIEVLQGLPIERLYLDAVTDPGVVEYLTARTVSVPVGVGLLDARNVRAENPDQLAATIRPIVERQGTGRVWVHPSSGLELLPPDRAADKVRLLGTLKSLINGTKG